mmetsp:Transcript_4458/g.11017  ORF Transcript_4458/g.11017 Transcript_4458/m.11017 type:complete len:255 (+) Transcript_4458:646-1410(+)
MRKESPSCSDACHPNGCSRGPDGARLARPGPAAPPAPCTLSDACCLLLHANPCCSIPDRSTPDSSVVPQLRARTAPAVAAELELRSEGVPRPCSRGGSSCTARATPAAEPTASRRPPLTAGSQSPAAGQVAASCHHPRPAAYRCPGRALWQCKHHPRLTLQRQQPQPQPPQQPPPLLLPQWQHAAHPHPLTSQGQERWAERAGRSTGAGRTVPGVRAMGKVRGCARSWGRVWGRGSGRGKVPGRQRRCQRWNRG